jgi:hypothetical protein
VPGTKLRPVPRTDPDPDPYEQGYRDGVQAERARWQAIMARLSTLLPDQDQP